MTTTTQGLTSPHRHTKPARIPGLNTVLALLAIVATPIFEWLDDSIEPRVTAWFRDLTVSERVYVATRTTLLVLLATVALTALAACKPTDTIPGTGYDPSAVVIDTTPTPAPAPTTTWEQVGA